MKSTAAILIRVAKAMVELRSALLELDKIRVPEPRKEALAGALTETALHAVRSRRLVEGIESEERRAA